MLFCRISYCFYVITVQLPRSSLAFKGIDGLVEEVSLLVPAKGPSEDDITAFDHPAGDVEHDTCPSGLFFAFYIVRSPHGTVVLYDTDVVAGLLPAPVHHLGDGLADVEDLVLRAFANLIGDPGVFQIVPLLDIPFDFIRINGA